MVSQTINSIRPFVRYSRYVMSRDFNKFNFDISAFDNRLFYCKRGSGYIVIEEKKYEISHGTLALIPAGNRYSYFPDKKNPMQLLALNFDYDDSSSHLSIPIPPVKTDSFDKTKIVSPVSFSDYPILNTPLVFDKMNIVEAELERINSEYIKKELFYEIRCSDIFHTVLTRIILRTEHETTSRAELVADRIIEYIRTNYSKEITLATIGEVFGYHPNYLNSLFVRQTGKTIYAYLLDFRIGEAINLLENTRIPVSEISNVTGFSDLSHFSKTFKKKTGHNPTDFRIV